MVRSLSPRSHLMPDKAATLNNAAVRVFKPIPAHMWNTLTVDNGKEFAGHKSLLQALVRLVSEVIDEMGIERLLRKYRVGGGASQYIKLENYFIDGRKIESAAGRSFVPQKTAAEINV